MTVPEKGFEPLEHTADKGIRARGGSLEELFENAAAGMFEIMADTSSVEERERVELDARAGDLPGLMVEWLEELLFISETRGLALKRAEVWRLREGWEMRGAAIGDDLERARGALRGEIKGITFHGLEVKGDSEGRWSCTVYFDV